MSREGKRRDVAAAGEGGARRAGVRQLVPEAAGQPVGERASATGVVLFSALVFAVALLVVAGVGTLLAGAFTAWVALAAFLCAVLAAMSIHIAQQWERVVVLRLGKFNRVSGPGIFWTFPFLEQNAIRVDCRVRPPRSTRRRR